MQARERPDDDGTILHTNQALVVTATVTIQVLKIGHKQFTLSNFRQLRDEDLIDPYTVTFNGPVWGFVNYHPDKCADEAEHLHVVWQKGGDLRRAYVSRQRPWVGTSADEDVERRARAELSVNAELDAALSHLRSGWAPRKLDYGWKNTSVSYKGLKHRPTLRLDHDRRTDLMKALVAVLDQQDEASRCRKQAAEYRAKAETAPEHKPPPEPNRYPSFVTTRAQYLEYADGSDRSAVRAERDLDSKRSLLCQWVCIELQESLFDTSVCPQAPDEEHDVDACLEHFETDRSMLLAVLADADEAVTAAEEIHRQRVQAWQRAYDSLYDDGQLFIAV